MESVNENENWLVQNTYNTTNITRHEVCITFQVSTNISPNSLNVNINKNIQQINH